MQWKASQRFLKDHSRASPPLQGLAEREVQRMQTVVASRKDWTSEWRQMRGIRKHKILELELGGGPRLLAHVGNGAVTLLAMGDHEITSRYAARGNVESDLARAEDLPSAFQAG